MAGVLGSTFVGNRVYGSQAGNKTQNPAKIIDYRRLGRTGLWVSDIGTGAPYSEQLLKATLEAGVNFIETSESYSNGRNEVMIGKVIKKFKRDKLFIATKASPTFRVYKSANDVTRRAEESLNRLQTDYIDIYMIHQAQNIIKVADKYFHRAADRLKKDGKIRFTGLSCHGPTWGRGERESLEGILMAAIEDGRFDVLLFPYNFLNPDLGERIINACKEKDIGTMIMKSNPVVVYDNFEKILNRGGEMNRDNLRDYEELRDQMKDAAGFFSKYGIKEIDEMKEAAIQFILTNKNVNTICCRFPNYSDIDRYINLSGTKLNEKSNPLLEDFRQNLGSLNCRIGCNICEQACPYGIPINTILRYNYYFISHNQQKQSMNLYKNLGIKDINICNDCPGYCERNCPYGVLTRPLLAIAHQNLDFTNQI